MKRTGLGLLAAVLGVTVLVAGCAGSTPAGKYPDGPVKLVVGYKVGGVVDVRARALQPVLEEILGSPVIVENMDGGGGSIAADSVKKAKKDGQTLLVVHMPSYVALRHTANQNFDYLKDFTPIFGYSGEDFSFISVRPDSPIKTLDDFIKALKERKVSCALAGFGSNSHIVLSVFANQIKPKELVVVPYTSSSESMTQLIGGHVDCSVTATGGAVTKLVSEGKVRALAISSEKRLESLSGVPTFKELGHNVFIEGLHGIVAPAGVPPATIKALEAAMEKATKDPRFVEASKKIGAAASTVGAEEFAKRIDVWQKAANETAPMLKATMAK